MLKVDKSGQKKAWEVLIPDSTNACRGIVKKQISCGDNLKTD